MESNMVAKRNADGVIAVADPFSPSAYHTNAQSVIQSMLARKDERTAQFDALGDIDAAPLEAVKELRLAIAEDDSTLKDYKKTLKDAFLALSGFKAVVVQMEGAKARIDPISVRGKLAEMMKVLKAREDAERVTLPKDDYCLFVNCDGDQLKKLLTAVERVVGKDYKFGRPQTDREFAAMTELKKMIKCN